jgi:hypothetical protein
MLNTYRDRGLISRLYGTCEAKERHEDGLGMALEPLRGSFLKCIWGAVNARGPAEMNG